MGIPTVATALALSGGLTWAMGAAEPTAQGHPTRSFDGSCDFSGTVVFDPPLTNFERATRQRATAVGRCSGKFTTVNGHKHQLDHERVLYRATSSGDLSCASSTAKGAGTLEYEGHKLRFRLSEDRVTAGGTLGLAGKAGGAFEAALEPTGDLATTVRKCSGKGLPQTDVKFSGSSTPTISG